MPELLRLLSCILYFTSHDQGEPCHVHVVQFKYRTNRIGHSEKLWIKENGDTEICNYKGNIKLSVLKRIQAIIKEDKMIFDSICQEWCNFYDEDHVEFYSKNEQEDKKMSFHR